MLLERTLRLCREKEYEVDMEFLKSIITVTIHDRKAQCKLAEIFMSADAHSDGIATEMLAQICLYEHDAMEYNPDALLSAETLAKLKPADEKHMVTITADGIDSESAVEALDEKILKKWAETNYVPVSEVCKSVLDDYRETICGEKLPVDEVSEARMSYYRVSIDPTISRHMYGINDVHIYVKVDEYREVVKAGYASDKCAVCCTCGTVIDVCDCKMEHYLGTQFELDKGIWVELEDGDYVPEFLPFPNCQLIQKLPSEVANDN